jgi:hypothetical protein
MALQLMGASIEELPSLVPDKSHSLLLSLGIDKAPMKIVVAVENSSVKGVLLSTSGFYR